MSNLSMVEAKLPPGFRFHPRDEELICDYLMKKVTCCEYCPLLIEVDLNKCEPWDIPETACVGGKEWYFYSQRDRKYATGLRTNRATVSGYWKATGKDRPIGRKGSLVGMRKTLVFYQGRAPKGRKSDWVMHEFRHEEGEGPLGPPKFSSLKEDWVLCRVFNKNREGPAKQVTIGSYGDTIIGSSFLLPPLMDSSYITFDQTQTQTYTNTNTIDDHDDQYDKKFEQVPCFSIFTSPDHQINHPTFPDHHNIMSTHMDMDMDMDMDMIMEQPALANINTSTKSTSTSSNYSATTFGFGAMASPGELGSCNLGPFSCDKKVLDAVLSHLTKMDSSPNYMKGSPPSLGEGSSESFLSVSDVDVGLPLMWNH